MNCDSLAPWYRWLEYASFGRDLERRRFAFLPELGDPRCVLMLGEGDGRFLARFARQYPKATVDYLDTSAKMLSLAHSRLRLSDAVDPGRVCFHQVDARTGRFPQSGYDLIVTHFFLDCFPDQEACSLVERIAACALADARWLVSEFHQPTSGWRAVRAYGWLRLLYAAFRLTTGLRTSHLPGYGPALKRCGFVRQQVEFASANLLISELWVRTHH